MYILSNVSVLEKLTKMRALPTLCNVIQRYFWRQHELKARKGPNFQSVTSDVASLVENIHHTWIFANLGTSLLSSQRNTQKIKTSISRLSSLKAQVKSRLQSPSYLNKIASFEKKCDKIFDIAHANAYFDLIALLMKMIFPTQTNGKQK